jgi:hypothetical protein
MAGLRIIPGGLPKPMSYRKAIGKEVWVGQCVVTHDPEVDVPENHFCYTNGIEEPLSRHYIVGPGPDMLEFLGGTIATMKEDLHNNPSETFLAWIHKRIARLEEIQDCILSYIAANKVN